MAERVGRPWAGRVLGPALTARLQALPPAAWIGALLLGAFLFSLAVSGLIGAPRPGPTGTILGPFTGDPTHFTVRYEVHKVTSATVSCRLEAQDDLHSVVGTLSDTVAGPSGTLVRTVTIPTRHRAVTALVDSCVVSSG